MSQIVIGIYNTKTRELIGNQGVVDIGPDQGIFIDLQGGSLRLCYAGDTASVHIPNVHGGIDTLITETRRPEKPNKYGKVELDIRELIS